MELTPIKQSLEQEKNNFFAVMNEFIDGFNYEQKQFYGRPRIKINDILKCLLSMSYNGGSYRRTQSDIQNMYHNGFISSTPKRSTLCKYMLDPKIKEILERLIVLSARSFIDVEDTVLVDSTWYGNFLPMSGRHKRNVNTMRSYFPLDKTHKLHVMCFLQSQVIICAKPTIGTVHDSKPFKEMLSETLDNGFKVKRLLADKGYSGKDNMALCEELGIEEVFIDFKKNASLKNPKSFLWKKQLKLYKEHPEIWHEAYRFRVKIEALFSLMKRKGKNYLRCQKSTSRDNEVLLKALWHNLTMISKFMDSL